MPTLPNLLPMPRSIQMIEGTAATDAAVTEHLEPNHPSQGYRLNIGSAGITLAASSDTGLFYARQTLAQLRRLYPQRLPAMHIEDSPDFPVRGVMLDISRDKVPSMQSLYHLIDTLAQWKINQLQLYTEHTFAYRNHQVVWRDASPMTADEIRALDVYCRERFIELVPNQNSFGHMDRWLKHAPYRHLAECPDGFRFPWGAWHDAPFSLYPAEPGSLDLIRELYAELLPNFSSRLFNIGCDETFDLGQGRSKEAAEKVGSTRLYLEFLKKVHALATGHGRTVMFWGDIILHQPQLIAELPRPIIALEWGYEANSPFDRDGELFAKAGIPFYVCPGTSSWCTIAGRTDNALGNLASAAENGLKHGASGFLNTDWGDYGHLQYAPISYLGFAAGAAYSWCFSSNRNLSLPRALDTHAFHDGAGVMGQLAYDLGNVYQACGKLIGNSSALFRILQNDQIEGLSIDGLQQSLAAIDTAMAPLARAQMGCPDARLIADEFTNAAAMLRYACHRGIALLEKRILPAGDLPDIIAEHRRLWLTRNRLGGLSDSCARLERMLPG